MGISFYATTFVLGIGFSAFIELKYIAVNAGWHKLDQVAVGLV